MSKSFRNVVVVICLAVFASTALSGCKIKAKRYDYHSAEETPKGPGIFTGKKGSITVGR